MMDILMNIAMIVGVASFVVMACAIFVGLFKPKWTRGSFELWEPCQKVFVISSRVFVSAAILFWILGKLK